MKYKVKQSDDDVIKSIYNNRNINNDMIDRWLGADESAWEPPENYPMINEAYECLMKHIDNNDDIFIVSDSDNDGVFSCGILMNFIIKYLKYENVYYILHDGKQHGITKNVLNKCLADKVSLLITPDAGSSDYKHIKILLDNGIDFIATDHHEFNKERIPKGAIIVNNQYDEVQNKNGSGTLVTYKFIYYIAEMEGIDIGYDYLTQCHISNIADMMELNGENLENRYIYNIGSDVSIANNKLIKSFIRDLGKKKKISVEDVSFGIAPKINAFMRCGSMDDKEMLMEASIGLTDEEVKYKYRGNIKSQSIYDAILRISNRLKSSQKRQIEKYANNLDVIEDDKILIISGNNIESNLRGVLCNKLLSTYGKPIIVLSDCDGELKGSCRGLGDKSFKDLCESSGKTMYCQGHSNSFGIGILRNNLDEFIAYMNKELMGVDFYGETEIDYIYNEGYIPLDDILDLGDIDDIWCFNCKRPKLLIKNMKIDSSKIIKKGIELSYKDEHGILYKRDFCSKIFYQDLIKEEENPNHDKMLNVDMIVEVKTTENNKAYVNILEFVSNIVELN